MPVAQDTATIDADIMIILMGIMAILTGITAMVILGVILVGVIVVGAIPPPGAILVEAKRVAVMLVGALAAGALAVEAQRVAVTLVGALAVAAMAAAMVENEHGEIKKGMRDMVAPWLNI